MNEGSREWQCGRRIVVTGGAGFLGRVVVRKLRERGCTEITFPRRATCDLSRWDHIEQLFDKYRPHLLLHLAATVVNPASYRDVAESFYNNAMMAMQLMEASSRHGVEKMICIGSASSHPANACVSRTRYAGTADRCEAAGMGSR